MMSRVHGIDAFGHVRLHQGQGAVEFNRLHSSWTDPTARHLYATGRSWQSAALDPSECHALRDDSFFDTALMRMNSALLSTT